MVFRGILLAIGRIEAVIKVLRIPKSVPNNFGGAGEGQRQGYSPVVLFSHAAPKSPPLLGMPAKQVSADLTFTAGKLRHTSKKSRGNELFQFLEMIQIPYFLSFFPFLGAESFRSVI